MSHPAQLELKMLATLQRQIALYQQALPLAKQIDANYGLDQSTEQSLDQMNVMVQQATLLDSQVLELKKECTQLGMALSDSVRTTSAQLASLIKEMLDIFSSLESKAQAVKNQLSPQVTSQIQAQQMHAAYTQTPEPS